MLRVLLHRLQDGETVLVDRHYGSYLLIAPLCHLGIDFVVQTRQCRTAQFRRGRRLGRWDHIVSWPRPEQPDWIDDATYASMPESITVRELEIRVD